MDRDLTDLNWLSNMSMKMAPIEREQENSLAQTKSILSSASSLLSELESINPKCLGSHEKPPCSFPALIALAIANAPEGNLAVSDIYAWMMKNFPFFSDGKQQAWKNSVRHNLSSNKLFLRLPTCGRTKTCAWAIDASIADAVCVRARRLGSTNASRRKRSSALSDAEKCKRKRLTSEDSALTSTDSESDVDILRAGLFADDSDSCPSIHGDRDTDADLFGAEWALLHAMHAPSSADLIAAVPDDDLLAALGRPRPSLLAFDADSWESSLLDLL